jgi:hypothetical protein
MLRSGSLPALALAAAAFVAACASSQGALPPPAPPPDPRIGVDAAALADAACKCVDAACLEEKHGALAKLEEAHGGIDALPPDAYAAHAKLDRCWREGTMDLARDLAFATTQLCTCHDSSCIRQAMGEIDRVGDKYRNAPIPAGAEAKVRETQRELEGCEAEKIASGPVLVPKLEEIAQQACACRSAGCANGAMKRFDSASAGILFVRHEGDTEGRLRRAKEDLCTCTAKLGIAAALPGVSPGAIDVSCHVGP